jgi:uncharacterized coiled-coil protein SlyX
MESLQEKLNHLYDKLTSRQSKKRELAAAH